MVDVFYYTALFFFKDLGFGFPQQFEKSPISKIITKIDIKYLPRTYGSLLHISLNLFTSKYFNRTVTYVDQQTT